MKREIKFRGKSVKSGKWLYGYLGEAKGKVLQSIYREKVIFENLEWFNTDNFGFVVNDYMVDEDTIGQFTGLTDKNGKAVYEGDICKITETVINGIQTFNVIVKWHNEAMAFVAYGAKDAQVPMSWFKNLTDGEVEVIGNVFDNKDLLEE